MVRHTDLGERRQESHLVELIRLQPCLVHLACVDAEAGSHGIRGVLESDCEDWCAQRGECRCGAGRDRVGGCGNGNGRELSCTCVAGVECNESAAENRGSENECCELLTECHARVPLVGGAHRPPRANALVVGEEKPPRTRRKRHT